MRIKEWWFKNYKSYGTVKETITLRMDKGELILLYGSNGKGKSSILSSLDLAIFGEELNRQGKRLSQKLLPNRINGNLEVGVIFETDQELYIQRTMESLTAPLKTKLVIDKIPFGKANGIDDKILEKVGFDFKTFKSFISMNINHFKNFISLSPEEKRILLDKLFNLETINELNKILKQLAKNNDISFSSINKEIAIYRQNITDLQATIKRVSEKKVVNNDNKINELKQIIEDNKDQFIALDEKKQELEGYISDIQEKLSELSLKKRDIDRDIIEINEKIDLFKSGKCPTCHTLLIGELNLLPEFEERLDKTNKVLSKLVSKIQIGREELTNSQNEFREVNKQYNDLMSLLTQTKASIKTLKAVTVEDVSTDEFQKNVDTLSQKVEEKEEEYLEVQKLKFVYDSLLPIWGESGIKRDIIDSIVGPLNEFIVEDLTHLKTRFKVELDNNFDAHVYEYNQEIDPETLSTGEAKKVNLCIMLSYIKMLRLKRDINVLFLDEVFAGIDVESIDDMLILFKKFANERNVNVFLVHHSELKEHFFDRIISVNKGSFSYIEQKQLN